MEKPNENDKIAKLKEKAENTPEVKKIKKAEKIVEYGLLISGAAFILSVIASIIIIYTNKSGNHTEKAVPTWLNALIYFVFAVGACFVIARIIIKFRYHQELTAQIDLIQTVDETVDDTAPFGELGNKKPKRRATVREEAFDVDNFDKTGDDSDGGISEIREELNKRDRVSAMKKHIAFDAVAAVLAILYCFIVLLPFVTVLGEKIGMFGKFETVRTENGTETAISLNRAMFADAFNLDFDNIIGGKWFFYYFYLALFIVFWIVVAVENALFFVKLILSLFSCETCIRNQKFKISMIESFLSKRRNRNLTAYNIGFFVGSFAFYVLPSYNFVKKATDGVDLGELLSVSPVILILSALCAALYICVFLWKNSRFKNNERLKKDMVYVVAYRKGGEPKKRKAPENVDSDNQNGADR